MLRGRWDPTAYEIGLGKKLANHCIVCGQWHERTRTLKFRLGHIHPKHLAHNTEGDAFSPYF